MVVMMVMMMETFRVANYTADPTHRHHLASGMTTTTTTTSSTPPSSAFGDNSTGDALEHSDFPDDNDPYDDIESLWVWTVIDGLLMIVILFGNTLTILAVTLSRRLSSLISNQFVLNLAISDLTVGLTLPYHLAFYLDTELGRMKETCVLRFMLIMLACSASILNLIAIAVDRYIAILHPLHYTRYMTKTATRALMVVAWALAVSASVVPIFWNNWGEMVNTCDVHKVIPKEYTTNVLAPLFSLVWIVMFVLYWRIWREASMHARRMRTTTCCPAGPNDWKSVQVVLMVLGSFSMCWMPYVVVVCTQTATVYKSHSQILYKAVFSLAVANSGINPVIYAWKNTGFRRAFMRLLRCQNPDYQEFDRSFRNDTHPPTTGGGASSLIEEGGRKAPMDSVKVDQHHRASDEPQSDVVSPGADKAATNNNGVAVGAKTDRCRIIENMAYDDGDAKYHHHTVENLAFDGSLDTTNIRMIDSRPGSDSGSLGRLSMIKSDYNYHGSKCSV